MLMQFTLKAWCSCSWFLDFLPFSFSFDFPPFLFLFFKFWTKCFYFYLSSTIVNAHDCNTILHVFVVCPRKLWFLFTNFGLVSIEFMFVFGFHNIALLKVWILVKFVWSFSFYCFLLCLLWTSIVYSSQNSSKLSSKKKLFLFIRWIHLCLNGIKKWYSPQSSWYNMWRKQKKLDGDFKFNSLDHTRCCDMDLCQQIHLCDSTLIWWGLQLMDDLLHRMWLAKSAKRKDSWYHGH